MDIINNAHRPILLLFRRMTLKVLTIEVYKNYLGGRTSKAVPFMPRKTPKRTAV